MGGGGGERENGYIESTIMFCLCYTGEYCSYLNGRTHLDRGSCIALEHCVSYFNNRTGQCPGNQCEPGWMGPGCQYGR